MSSITGVQLKSRLEENLALQLDKKNNFLKIGKSVKGINRNLLYLYNYWVLNDMCALTSTEINCIVNEIRPFCDFSKPVRLHPVDDDVRVTTTLPQASFTEMSATVVFEACVASSRYGADGQVTLVAQVSGGSGTYTYLWECVVSAHARAGLCGDLTLTDETTDTLSVDNINYRNVYRLKVTITDSIGNEVVVLVDVDDELVQKGICGSVHA